MESPWIAMVALGLTSRPNYTEVATAEAVTFDFWFLLRLKVIMALSPRSAMEIPAAVGAAMVSLVACPSGREAAGSSSPTLRAKAG